MSEVSFVQTLCFDAKDFTYETLEQINGNASVISFEIDTKVNNMGDVVVVLSDGEIVFHGMITKVHDGWALAADNKDSLLPATVQ
jgi:ABC-type uncharacterized transport system ATPase subunit